MKSLLIPSFVVMSIALPAGIATGASAAAPGSAAVVSDDPACSPRVQLMDAERKASTLFNKLDTDSDGLVSEGEYVAVCMPTTNDPNRRGLLASHARKNFASLNPNDDGQLTLAEYRMAIGTLDSQKSTKETTKTDAGSAEATMMLAGVSAGDLIGQYIVNRNDQVVGRVQDVVVDRVTGKDYAVVETNELLRTDAEYLALQLDQLQVVRKMAPVVVVFDTSSDEDLKQARSYDAEKDKDKFERAATDKYVNIDRFDVLSKEQRLHTQ